MIARLALAAALASPPAPAPAQAGAAAPASATPRSTTATTPAPATATTPASATPTTPAPTTPTTPAPTTPATPASPTGASASATGAGSPDETPDGSPRPGAQGPQPGAPIKLTTPTPELPPPQNLSELGLRPQRDGTMLYVDPSKRFTAVFNADGTVRFGNRWGRDQYGKRVRGSGWALRQVNPAGLGIAGPAEWLLALQDRFGGPERHASAKRELMNRTAALRTKLTIAWTLNLLARRLGELDRELFDLWNAAEGTPAQKRELLFQRWDECDEAFAIAPEGEITEDARSEIDRARADTAEQARRVIEAFVRRQLPRGSAAAYTAAELAAMNRRRTSKQAFRPYDVRRGP